MPVVLDYDLSETVDQWGQSTSIIVAVPRLARRGCWPLLREESGGAQSTKP